MKCSRKSPIFSHKQIGHALNYKHSSTMVSRWINQMFHKINASVELFGVNSRCLLCSIIENKQKIAYSVGNNDFVLEKEIHRTNQKETY